MTKNADKGPKSIYRSIPGQAEVILRKDTTYDERGSGRAGFGAEKKLTCGNCAHWNPATKQCFFQPPTVTIHIVPIQKGLNVKPTPQQAAFQGLPSTAVHTRACSQHPQFGEWFSEQCELDMRDNPQPPPPPKIHTAREPLELDHFLKGENKSP